MTLGYDKSMSEKTIKAAVIDSYFRNICKSVNDYTKGDGFYWVKESDLDKWFPVTTHSNFVAEVDDNDNIINVERSPIIIEKREK